MDSARMLTSIEEYLAPLVKQEGAVLDVASDIDHALELLATGPKAWRVVLHWLGLEPLLNGDHGVVNFQWSLIIQAAKGLPSVHGNDVHRGNPSRPPILERMDQVSQWMRNARFCLAGTGDNVGRHVPSNDVEFDRGSRMISAQWLAVDGIPTRQIQLDFEITIGLDTEVPTPLLINP